MPPKRDDSNSDMHSAPIQRPRSVDALTQIWRSPCPSEWGSIVESICNLANAILLNDEWDPSSLQLPAQHLVPNTIILEDDIPFGIRRVLIVDIPVDSKGTVDLYFDNFCGLTVDIDNNATRLERAPLLAFVSAAREVAEIEPLPCDDS